MSKGEHKGSCCSNGSNASRGMGVFSYGLRALGGTGLETGANTPEC
jgi:hypothetical protein